MKKDYQTFSDGTMNILVDGQVQRRGYYQERNMGLGRFANTVTPDTKDGEELLRYMDGGMEIITIKAQGAGT